MTRANWIVGGTVLFVVTVIIIAWRLRGDDTDSTGTK